MFERTKTKYHVPALNPVGTLLRLQAEREEISSNLDTCQNALDSARTTHNVHMVKVLGEIHRDLSAERREVSHEILDVMDHDAREYLLTYRSRGLSESENVIRVLEDRRQHVREQREILDAMGDEI